LVSGLDDVEARDQASLASSVSVAANMQTALGVYKQKSAQLFLFLKATKNTILNVNYQQKI
jgi:hypothetical protein